MDRLLYIRSINPTYADDIEDFLMKNDEFCKLLPLVALSCVPTHVGEFTSAKECLKYYVYCSGVRADYGEKLYEEVKNNNYANLKSKLKIIQEIDAINEPNTPSDIDNLIIKGVGDGCKIFVKQMYFNDNSDGVYPTDRVFRKGLAKIYNKTEVSVDEAKQIIALWKISGAKTYIGGMFTSQAASYY